ncbi:MAG: iron-sulfur cluster assembly accessory protein [Myxococcota bacterium]
MTLPMAQTGPVLADAPLSVEAPNITVTPKAASMGKKQLVDWSADAEGPVYGLRLGVKGGGCSGYYYVYEVATKVRKKDKVWDFDGLRIVVDPRSLELLAGGVLDWEQRLMGYGFKWENPNATGDCGCGSSFNV